jgi:hypothetical protein
MGTVEKGTIQILAILHRHALAVGFQQQDK